MVNARLSQAAAPWGLHYAPDPSSQTVCTIGGNVAENAGGPHCRKYGVTTQHILALRGRPAVGRGRRTRFNKPAVYSIHDVYPDVGIKLGVFRHPLVIRTVATLERTIADRARYVRILSESFAAPVLAMGVSKDSVRLIYDWVDTQLITPMPKDNDFAREFNLVDTFVVLYAGNIGLSQGLDKVLKAAEVLANHASVRFVFVGDGAGKARLVDQAQNMKLNNVQFIPFQPRSRLPAVLAAADVSLVILQRGIGLRSLPSKSFSILASGRPILASVEEDSDMTRLVQRSRAGVCVPPEDVTRMANAILDVSEHTVHDPGLYSPTQVPFRKGEVEEQVRAGP